MRIFASAPLLLSVHSHIEEKLNERINKHLEFLTSSGMKVTGFRTLPDDIKRELRADCWGRILDVEVVDDFYAFEYPVKVIYTIEGEEVQVVKEQIPVKLKRVK